MERGVFGKVVVPVEFEAAGEAELATDRAVEVTPKRWVVAGPSTVRALQLAARLAAGGEVRLVHATPDLHATSMYGGPDGSWINAAGLAELDESARQQTRKVLERLAAVYCEGVDLAFAIAPGSALEVIMQAALAQPADAIILAASGRGRVRRAVLGSVADKVIRRAACPVLVVPSGTP